MLTPADRALHILYLQRTLLHRPVPALFLFALPLSFPHRPVQRPIFLDSTGRPSASSTLRHLHEPLVRGSHGTRSSEQNRFHCAVDSSWDKLSGYGGETGHQCDSDGEGESVVGGGGFGGEEEAEDRIARGRWQEEEVITIMDIARVGGMGECPRAVESTGREQCMSNVQVEEFACLHGSDVVDVSMAFG